MSSTLGWLRSRSDEELAGLLAARPDLLLPTPPDLAALARRMDGPSTVRRAVGQLNSFELQVLQAVWLLWGGWENNSDDVEPEDDDARGDADGAGERIRALLGGPADRSDVAGAAAHLELLGLIRPAKGVDTSGYLLAPAVREALGRYPAGLGGPGGLADADVSDALAATDAAGLAILNKLVPGPPVGSVEIGSRHAAAIARLIDSGLLVGRADGTVALPREVALALRGERPLGPALPRPPELVPVVAATAGATAAGQALTAHGHAVALLGMLGIEPALSLKTGGIGIVAVRALAKRLDIDVHAVATYLEVLHGAGLIAPAVIRGLRRSSRQGEPAGWVPTQAADTFLAGSEPGGWALMAATWLDMRRNPDLVGRRDAADKLTGALTAQGDWRSGPEVRRRILGELAALGDATGADRTSLAERLAYRAPLQHAGTLAAQVDSVLREATELGIVAFDALPAAGRHLLDDDIEGAAVALDRALPDPVDTVLVQADMTMIAPGRLTPGLAAALAEFADVESAGSATVYRINEGSVRRALDAGYTGAALRSVLEAHAAAPVPQSVVYLIEDVARRHGVLRAGSAEAFLHSDDAALMAQGIAAAAAAGIPLRSLAPTVAVSPVDVTTLVEALRAAGLAPAAENSDGTILDLRPPPRRTRITAVPRNSLGEPAPPSADQIAAVVRRMRAGDQNRSGAVDPGGITAVLAEAARTRSAVWIGYADAQGATTTRMVEPIVVSGGTMVGFDRLRQAPRTFTIHRISSASPAQG